MRRALRAGKSEMDEYWHTLLQTTYGYQTFRTGQLEALRSIGTHTDTVAILPTSAGKSLIYFLAARHLRTVSPHKFTVVVSPLISLMEDQVRQAPPRMHCALLGTAQEDLDIDRKVWVENRYDLVFVSPERLQSFAGPDLEQRVSLLVIDEAHCIVQDGKSYRPSYLALGEFRRQYLPSTTTVAVTATATAETCRELQHRLGMRRPLTIRTSLFRPNLSYHLCPRPPKPLALLLSLLGTSGRGIVYARTRNECEQLADSLLAAGVDAVAYHAGLEMAVRKRIHTATHRCVVATVSFGMGVNIPDIRSVVHIGIAKSLAAYMQETGRAGRDGLPSRCTLLYHPSDARRLLHMTSEAHEQRDLRLMDAWAQQTTGCRVVALLAHFRFTDTDTTHHLHGPTCLSLCDLCCTKKNRERCVTTSEEQQRMFCRAVHQTGNYHGEAFHILYLRGSKNKKVLRFAQVADPTVHGHGTQYTTTEWRTVHQDLLSRRFLVQKHTRTGTVIFRLTDRVPVSWYIYK